MTFPATLRKLSDAATQGEWRLINSFNGDHGAIQCGKDGGFSLHLLMPKRAANMELIALLVNRRREILALVESARQASFCLRELLPDDIDAKMTVAVLDAALANLDEVKP